MSTLLKAGKVAALITAISSFSAYADNFIEVHNAFFPPVPEYWTQKIENNSVIYSAPVTKKGQEPVSVVKLTYSRATAGKTAENLIDEYIELKHCDSKQKIGKDFYMTTCKFAKVDAIFVGEINNMYSIEINGVYNHESKAIVNKYLNDIVKGKRIFKDRTVAEKESNEVEVTPISTAE